MLYLLFAFLALSSAHVCIVQPLQRGPIPDFNKVGVPDCGLTTGPCGGRPLGPPTQILKSGGEFTVVFQKNRDHWTSNNTGYFLVSYEKVGQHGSFKQLAKILDTNVPALTLLSAPVKLPDHEYPHAIISVQYVVPTLGIVFFQCADVELRHFE